MALLTSGLGYFSASALPALFGKEPVNAAGAMAVTSGVLLTLALVASPSHGLVARALRRRRLATSVALDDLLAALYRAHEAGMERVETARVRSLVLARAPGGVLQRARRRGLVTMTDEHVALTGEGEDRARRLVRRHRLWETYLVEEAGFAPDHVHDTAERLEHFGEGPERGPQVDPHGREIP